MTPPPLPLLLLRLLLPPSLREPLAGDLEEEWRRAARPSTLRFWNLALRSIASCWVDRLRRDDHRRTRAQQVNPPGDGMMQSLTQDVRYGLRLLWRNPVFTIAAAVTLALGIGANAAIFSIVNVLALKPLPYQDPGNVAFVLGWDLEENDMRFNLRHADFVDLQRESTTLELSAYAYVSANLTGGEEPDRVQAYRVTPNTFSLLGVPAHVGRVFENADAAAGRFDLAVISHGLWQRGFGGDRSIVGRRIVVNGEPYDVIGVMPQRFEYPVFNFKGDLWIPWRMVDSERGQAAATGSATVVARLRPGASYAQAQSELDLLMRGFADRFPATNRGLGARLTEMGKLDDEQAGPALAILLITVAMVLVLACANVANLLLARGVARHRELAVRAAMGASRLRLGRQLIAEAGLLAAAGGGLGVVFSFVALEGIRASLPEALLATVPNISELGVDWTTLAYTLGISVLTSLMFGVVPTWRASRDRFENALKESASAGGSRGTRRLRTALVISEVALATMLLVTAGLLVRSYGSLQRVSPGFDASNVMTAAVTLPDHKYANGASRQQFFTELLERVEQLPGVAASGLVNVLPFSTYDRGSRLVIDGQPIPDPGREPAIAYRVASPGYYTAMGIPLAAGRVFDRRDTLEVERVAIINRRAVEQHFGGQVPLGRRIRLGGADEPWLTIVGVVGDVLHSSLTRAPQPEVYVPMSQSTAAMMMLAMRTTARPEHLASPMRAIVQDIDPEQPIYHVRTLEALVGDALLPSRTSASMVTMFGGLALILAAIGIYGVVAYGVSQQAREFGVRMALGATPRDVVQLVLRNGLVMIGAGVLLGTGGALAVSGALRGALHGISSTDPGTYAAAAVVLTLTGIAACAVPAWRASATKPVSALRATD